MIHGYHVIWGMYGFWLPNDPRGSWSEFVNQWELRKFGNVKPHTEFPKISSEELAIWKANAQAVLKYPAVSITGLQALEIAKGFKTFIEESNLAVWALSILPEHLHMVLGRHRYKTESVCNHLKGAATRQLDSVGLHPLAKYRKPDGKLPSMWNSKQWVQYLDSEDGVYNAINYVEQNPIKEGKKRQKWSCVIPFEGISRGGWYAYY